MIVDDTTLDKLYAQHIELVHRHWSGKHHRVVAGINLVTLSWSDGTDAIPCDYRLYDRPVDGVTKHAHFRDMLATAKQRGFEPRLAVTTTPTTATETPTMTPTTGTAGPSPTATHTSVPSPTPAGGTGYRTYLPLVIRPPLPDLVARVRLEPDTRTLDAGDPVTITVDVINRGEGDAAPFWVDLFINPSQVPTGDLTWDRLCRLGPCYGLSWAVHTQLAPGQQITLRSTMDSYAAMYSCWPGFFASGTSELYVYVDSGVSKNRDGAVRETNETNNRVAIRDLRVTGPNPASVPRPNVDIPRRPRLTPE